MRIYGLLAATLASMAAAVCAHAAAPPLLVTFQNNTGQPASNIYVGFFGDELVATDAATKKPLLLTTYQHEHWYYLSTLPAGISLTKFTSGRIYVGYGEPWHLTRAGYTPSAATPTDPNYLKRYDKMEITYTGAPADVADLTSIDYFGVPMTLKVFRGGASGTLVAAAKGAATDTILPAVGPQTNPHNAAIVRDAGAFVRAIGPGIYPPPPGLPASPYPTFANYLAYLQAIWAPAHCGVVATVKGHFAGVGAKPTTPQTKPQDYDFTVKMNAAKTMTITGSSTAVAGQHTITITYAQLNAPTGIYGANPTFTLDKSAPMTPQNDIYGWVIGDLFSGLNIGAVGSPVTENGLVVGKMPSQDWFKLKHFFSTLQPAHPLFYNRWAAALAPISQAYGFAYSDRFAVTDVQVPLNPAAPQHVDTLQIVFMSDKAPKADAAAVSALTSGLQQ